VKGSVERGDKCFNSPKVKRVFSLVKAFKIEFQQFMLSTVEIQLYCLVKQMINTFLTFDFYRLLKNLSPFSTGPFRCTLYSR